MEQAEFWGGDGLGALNLKPEVLNPKLQSHTAEAGVQCCSGALRRRSSECGREMPSAGGGQRGRRVCRGSGLGLKGLGFRGCWLEA